MKEDMYTTTEMGLDSHVERQVVDIHEIATKINKLIVALPEARQYIEAEAGSQTVSEQQREKAVDIAGAVLQLKEGVLDRIGERHVSKSEYDALVLLERVQAVTKAFEEAYSVIADIENHTNDPVSREVVLEAVRKLAVTLAEMSVNEETTHSTADSAEGEEMTS